jgi:hypothetical protein
MSSTEQARAGISTFVGPRLRAYGVVARPNSWSMDLLVEGGEGAAATGPAPFGGRVTTVETLHSPPDDPSAVCERCGWAGHTMLSCPFT